VEYTTAQAARLTGCSEAQVRSWARSGLVHPHPATGVLAEYSFADLVALRAVAGLLAAGLGLARVRRAIGYVADADNFTGLRVVTDGETVWACRDERELLDALDRGGLAVVLAVDCLAADVDAAIKRFADERDAFVEDLQRVATP
jgi:DNA-binding transcriptional MerR regulator